jgi:hypothetical protein
MRWLQLRRKGPPCFGFVRTLAHIISVGQYITSRSLSAILSQMMKYLHLMCLVHLELKKEPLTSSHMVDWLSWKRMFCSTLLNHNFRECVVRNAMLLTNITSAVITTNRWRQWKSSGMRPGSTSTCSGLRWMVYLRTPAMLGPKMEQALVMCLGLMGQFLMVLFLTIPRNWASVGWPVMAWALRAAMASWTSRLVKPS